MFVVPIILALLGAIIMILLGLCMIAGIYMLIIGIIDREWYMFWGGGFFALVGLFGGQLIF